MLVTARDFIVPLDKVSFLVKSNQISTYLAVILAAILAYDSRTSLILMQRFRPLLKLCQSVHLTKRYVNESLQCGFVVTVRNW